MLLGEERVSTDHLLSVFDRRCTKQGCGAHDTRPGASAFPFGGKPVQYNNSEGYYRAPGTYQDPGGLLLLIVSYVLSGYLVPI